MEVARMASSLLLFCRLRYTSSFQIKSIASRYRNYEFLAPT